MRRSAIMFAVAATFFIVPSAQAAISDVFNGTIACTTQVNGQRWCGTGQFNANNGTRSTVQSFDGVPIDVNVAFPDQAEGDGPFPLVYMFHGYGMGKINFPDMNRFLDKGYAVFSQTNRGFHESCGTASAKAADPDCQTKGFVRLDDTRYEVRDAQLFAGMLVDEGLVEPTKIAANGPSYGGGMSMALAVLKNRMMMPDGTLVPWKSPAGTPMSLAVATPERPWTDLAYSLAPNGSTIDYIEDAPYYGRFGVMKQSFVNGLYAGGLNAPGYYALAGEQPEADLAGWKNFMDVGEPYDNKSASRQMIDELTRHHSSYYIDHSQAPAPLLINSGTPDDLFPVSEVTRFYNRTRAEFPNSPIGLFLGSIGHARSQNGPEIVSALQAKENEWIDYYLSGIGSKPASDVTMFTQVCPDVAPDGGPYVTPDWVSQSPGEIRILESPAQIVEPTGGDRAVGGAFNPAPGGHACTTAAGAVEPGTADYETPAAPVGGYTEMGAPTVIAKITQSGDNSQIAARLVDVTPDGLTKTLINRALYRPTGDGYQVFQLQPNGWKVEEGHILRLELLPFDGGNIDPIAGPLSNFGRPSNNQQPATIADVDLRIPVRESPGSLDGLVTAPANRVLPDRPGVKLAPGNEAIGSIMLTTSLVLKGNPKAHGRTLTARITCPASYTKHCARARFAFKGRPRHGKGRGVLIATRSVKVAGGKTAAVKFHLTAKARKLFRSGRKRIRSHGQVRVIRTSAVRSLRVRVLVNGKASGYATVRRTGRVR